MVGRTANGSCEQMADAFLKNLILWSADRVQEAFGFEIFVHLRRGEGGITSEIQSHLPTLVANDNRLQHAFPIIGTVNVAGTQGTPLQITELVEQEKGMVAGTLEAMLGRKPGGFLQTVDWGGIQSCAGRHVCIGLEQPCAVGTERPINRYFDGMDGQHFIPFRHHFIRGEVLRKLFISGSHHDK